MPGTCGDLGTREEHNPEPQAPCLLWTSRQHASKHISYSLVWMQQDVPGGSDGKHLPTVWETRLQALSWEELLEKQMATHSSILPGKSHRQRSLVGYSPRGHRESDMTERLHFLSLYGYAD